MTTRQVHLRIPEELLTAAAEIAARATRAAVTSSRNRVINAAIRLGLPLVDKTVPR